MDLERGRQMFTIGIVIGLFIGGIIGFFAATILVMGGRCSDEEERRPWPGGSIDR